MRKITPTVSVGEWAGAAKQRGPAPDSHFLGGDHRGGFKVRGEDGRLSRELMDECYFSIMGIPSAYSRRAKISKLEELLEELMQLYSQQGWSPPEVKSAKLFAESFGRGLDELLRAKRLQREREKAQQQRGRFGYIVVPWWR